MCLEVGVQMKLFMYFNLNSKWHLWFIWGIKELMTEKVQVSVAQSCDSLLLRDCGPHQALSREFSRQEHWSGLPPLAGAFLTQEEPRSPTQADSLPSELMLTFNFHCRVTAPFLACPCSTVSSSPVSWALLRPTSC